MADDNDMPVDPAVTLELSQGRIDLIKPNRNLPPGIVYAVDRKKGRDEKGVMRHVRPDDMMAHPSTIAALQKVLDDRAE